MKKTLLSVLAGLAVINAASAVPSPEDRKAMCDKYPDKYVWVEKNKACVPIDPCISSNYDIERTYCISDHFFPRDTEKRDLVLNRVAREVWKTQVVSIKDIGDSSHFGIFTADGGYLVGMRVPEFVEEETKNVNLWLVRNAFYAYGAYCLPNDDNTEVSGFRDIQTGEACQDIVDFADLLCGEILKFKYINGECTIYLK